MGLSKNISELEDIAIGDIQNKTERKPLTSMNGHQGAEGNST